MTRILLRDLAPGTKYQIQLRSKYGNNTSDWSPVYDFTTNLDAILPTQPTNIMWNSVGRSFLATWEAPTVDTTGGVLYNLGGYRVRISHVPSNKSVTYVINDTRFDFTYEMNEAAFGKARSPLNFEVQSLSATNPLNNSQFTSPVTGQNPIPTAPVMDPARTAIDMVEFSWSAAPDLDLVGYNVYASQTNGFSPGPTNLRSFVNGLQYNLVSPSTAPWYVHVRSVDIFGQESISSQVSGTITSSAKDTTAPANATALAATTAYDTTRNRSYITTTWTKSTDDGAGARDVQQYIIRYSSNGGTNWNYLYVPSNTTTARLDVDPATAYTIQIATQDYSGNTSVFLATSPTSITSAADTTAPSTPSAPVATGGVFQVFVNQANTKAAGGAMESDVDHYDVYMSTTNNFTTYDATTLKGSIQVGTVIGAVFTIPAATTNTTWYVKTVAVDKSNLRSPASAQATATVSLINSTSIDNAINLAISNAQTTATNAGNAAAVAIKSYVNEYSVNSSETVAPTTGWSTSTPTRTPGSFIWFRTTVTLNNNTTSTTNPALLTGNAGSTGSQGIPGTPGSNGQSLYTWLKYADTPTTGMSDDPTGKTYMGIAYNKSTATESSTYTDYEWTLIKGADGTDGKGISNTVVTYQIASSGTVAPTGTWNAAPTATTPGQFLWTRTVTTYTDATTTTAYAVSAHGATGSTGNTGATGTGISGTSVMYQVGNSGTTAPTGTWSAAPVATTTGQFLWTRTITTYTDATTATAYSVSAHGGTGAAGKGISSTAVTYQTATSGTVAPTGTWSASPTATTTGQFLWVRTITTYTDASTVTAYAVSAHGATGSTGSTGAAGRGVSGTTVTYQVGNSGTVEPTGTWSTSLVATTAPGQFLWTRTITTYTDSLNPTTAYAVSAHGSTGPQGNQGIQGPIGPNGLPTYTWIKYGTSATGAGFADLPDGKTYIGIAYNKTTQTESETPSDYEWSLIQGPQGVPGTPAASISLTSTTQVLTAPATGGATTPATAVVTGNAVNTTISAWEYSVDGGAFSATVPAGASRTGNVVTITGATMTARTIAVRMADANGIADTLTVAEVSNGATGATGNTGSTGAAGADAYTVILTNEAQVFLGSTTSANAGSTTTSVIAYKGAVQQTATIGTITGQVTGLTTAITNNGTNNATVTVTVTTALTTLSGTLTIPITVDGKSFTKTFSWSVGLAGAQGTTGNTGSTGVSVTAVTPFYAQVTTGSAAPASPGTVAAPPAPWVATEPTYVAGTELYTTNRITFSNTTYAYTAVVKSSSYAAAVVALTTANGKNKINYSTSAPTSSSVGAVGDFWMVRDATTGVISGQYELKTVAGSVYTWASQTIGNDVVAAGINAGKITVGEMSGDRITANTLTINKTTGLQSTLDAALNANPNLFPNSSFEKDDASASNVVTVTYPATPLIHGTRSMRVTRSATGDAYKLSPYNVPGAIVGGKTVTISWTARGTAGTVTGNQNTIQLQREGDGNIPAVNTVTPAALTSNAQRFSYTTTIPASASNYRLVFRTGANVNDYIEYDAVQVEVGDKATPWGLTPTEAAENAQNAAIQSFFINSNSTFSDWTGSWPEGSGVWGTGAPIKETVLVRTPPNAVRFTNSVVGDQWGMTYNTPLSTLPYSEYVVMEADVMLTSGNFNGSGLLLDWMGVTGNPRSSMHFATLEPSPALNKWYKFTQVFKRPTATGTWTGWNGYVMGNYSGLAGGNSAKSIIFDKVGLRPATQEEITAFNAPANLAAGMTTASNNAVASLKTLWGHPLDQTRIDGGDIYTQTIKANSLTLGDFTNYIADADLTDSSFSNWSITNGLTRIAAADINNPAYIQWVTASGGNAHIYNNNYFEVNPGDKFFFKCEVSAPSSNTNAVNLSGAMHAYGPTGATTTWPQLSPVAVTPGQGWTSYSGIIEIPAGVSSRAQFDPFAQSNSGTVAGQVIRMRRMSLRRMNGAELIVDGSITATKVGTNEIITNQANIKNGTITTAHITNATIGEAQITGGISANKLTAGTGIITDLQVGNGSNKGSLRSADYVAGTSGWKIGYDNTLPAGQKNLLEINDGLIKARTLELRNSLNLMPSSFTDFEGRASFYDSLFRSTDCVITVGAGGMNSTQALIINPNTSTAGWKAGLATVDIPYNIDVESGKQYIISGYLRSASACTVKIGLEFNTLETAASSDLAITTTYQRFSFLATATSTAQKAAFIIAGTQDVNVYVDRVMVEERLGALTTPSVWSPPSSTVIDGGQIKTNSITASEVNSSIITAGDVYSTTGYIGKLTFDQLEGGTIKAAVSMATEGRLNVGSRITIEEPKSNGTGGITIWGDDSHTIAKARLHPDGNYLDGILVAQDITVIKALRLTGTGSAIASEAQVKLENGVSDPPAPTLTAGTIMSNWPYVPENMEERGVTWDSVTGQWYRLLWRLADRATFIQTVSMSGVAGSVIRLAETPEQPAVPGNPGSGGFGSGTWDTPAVPKPYTLEAANGIAIIGDWVYTHQRFVFTGDGSYRRQWYINKHMKTNGSLVSYIDSCAVGAATTDHYPTLATDGGNNLYSLDYIDPNYVRVNKRNLDNFSISAETWISTSTLPDYLTSATVTTQGATTNVLSVQNHQGLVTHFDLTNLGSQLTAMPQYDFTTDANSWLGYKYGTGAAFYSFKANDRKMSQYSSYYPTNSEKWWAQTTDYSASGSTKASPESLGLSVPARRFVTVKLAPQPPGTTGSRVYVGYGVVSPGTTKKLRTEAIVDRSMTLTNLKVTGSDTMSTSNTMGGTAPAKLWDGFNNSWNGNGNGTLGSIQFSGSGASATVTDPLQPTDIANKRYVDSSTNVVNRVTTGLWNRNVIYPNNTSDMMMGPWNITTAEKNGSTKAHIVAEISCYAGGSGGSLQDCDHRLQVQINGGAWTDISSKYVTNNNVYWLTLGGVLSGWINYAASDTVSVRLKTNVAGGGFNVGVAGGNFMGTFFK